jgi:hypothetical protein
VTEGNPAIHASARLLLNIANLKIFINFAPIANPNIDRTPRWQLSICCEKTFGVTHDTPPTNYS